MANEKLNQLRSLMEKYDVQAYLIPSSDAHQNEYVPTMWERRKWLSGFTGSAGDMAVTKDAAGLWTDSRYFLQAEEQLAGSGIDLFKQGLPETPPMEQWLREQLKANEAVGIDAAVFSHSAVESMSAFFAEWNIEIKIITDNLIDEIWSDQPLFPEFPVELHPLKFSGESTESKIKRLLEKMSAEKTDAHVISTLDALAWLFNIRGKDIDFNPVVIGYAIVTSQITKLFVHKSKICNALKNHLPEFVQIFDYNNFTEHLEYLAENSARIWLDADTVNHAIVNILKGKPALYFANSPITLFKAQKNDVEIEGMRNAHTRDGAAMVKFLHWLENNVPKGGVTELSAADRAEKYRSEQKYFRGLSFNSISGYKAHGAIVHYSSSPETNVELKEDGIFLFDSGGQYADGTTDITRTVTLNAPSEEQKEMFTRVLKGMIQLSLARFPKGTAGNQLDTIARKPLWDVAKNYGHGTGHGVGSYLNVHEGPQGISFYRAIGVEMALGMVTSNEPGYYKAGEYGIRIENLILTVRDEENSSDENEFYKFETLTLCPIDLKLVKKSLLSEEEIVYLNAYHQRVYETLSPLLPEEEKQWLKINTRSI